jgi:hypothetical protein
MANGVRWTLAGGLFLVVAVAPAVSYRCTYTYGKRLREVVPGRFYRSGQMTAEGFADAVARFHIRTIINVQDDVPDPNIDRDYWSGRTVKESDLCARLGVHFVQISPDLISRRRIPEGRPEAIDKFLAVMDDEANYPVLLHCRAGLHRTGLLAAVYRMEYQGWSPAEAHHEMKAHGFGVWACTSANDYVTQYVLTYRPGRRDPPVVARAADRSQKSVVSGQ